MKTLDLELFRALVEEFKLDLQREANQWVLKRDVHAAASSLAAIDAVERLSHRVTARAFTLGESEKPQKVKLFNRRTKKQMAEARAQEAKMREFPSQKVASGN
jgi:hypothetical protein